MTIRDNGPVKVGIQNGKMCILKNSSSFFVETGKQLYRSFKKEDERERALMYKSIGPVKIFVYRNNDFFAKKDWLLYKHFGKTRSIPCGRCKEESEMCCCLSPTKENSYISADGKSIICKVCGNVHVLSSSIIDEIKDGWGDF